MTTPEISVDPKRLCILTLSREVTTYLELSVLVQSSIDEEGILSSQSRRGSNRWALVGTQPQERSWGLEATVEAIPLIEESLRL